VGLRGGVDRVHKHARHGGVSWRGRGRQPIRQAATSTAISASVFSPSDLSRHRLHRRHRHHGMFSGPIFRYRNQMRDSAQGHVLQLVEAFLSRLATYEPTRGGKGPIMKAVLPTVLHYTRPAQAVHSTRSQTGPPKLHYCIDGPGRPVGKNGGLGTGIGHCRGSFAMVSVGVFRRFGWFALFWLL
jgi:hypothetical protein